MPFVFRDTYNLEMSKKRKTGADTRVAKELSLKISTNIKANRWESARQFQTLAQNDLARLQSELNQAQTAGNQARIEQLQNAITAQQAQLDRVSQELELAEIDLIRQVLKDNSDINGKNNALQIGTVVAKYKAFKTIDPNINPLTFTQLEIQANPPVSPLNRITDETSKLSAAANRFRNIVEGKPDGQQAGLEARDPFAIFDPSVCGLIALDNEGSILADTRYNIPFQYVWGFKESKSAQYADVTPMGRFEPHKAYTGGGPLQISFDLAYMAYESGQNTDEGYIMEMKDRLMSTQYPIYGKNQQNGVFSYGAPNKYLLNVFSRYINIPVIIESIQFGDEYGYDPSTWFAMGFQISISLSTSYRLAQVVSADDIVTRGLRTYSHRFF